MKYLLLIRSNPARWIHPVFLHRSDPVSQGELDAMQAQYEALIEETSRSGELIQGVPLAEPTAAKIVRIRDGALTVTDGPFAEAKEQLAGYFVFECDTPERAVEIASRFPDAKFGAIEVRPIMDLSGMEM